jgi:hypothetical protein
MTSIDRLPDEVLLAIFDFCVYGAQHLGEKTGAWQSLVHVCRQWRSVVFGSPRRLNLRLFCTNKTPVRDALDVWPPLLLLVRGGVDQSKGLDNIIAALEHRDRVCQIDVNISHLESFLALLAAMQEPFPELTHLELNCDGEMTVPAIPDSFLGGSAPRLQYLWLNRIPFPGIPKLLLSATHLVELGLHTIPQFPHSGYFSPEALVAALSTLTSLGSLSLGFLHPGSRLDGENRRPAPLTRSVFPLLVFFGFKGAGDYLEDFVARIDAPRLSGLYITFSNRSRFDAPQLIQFICRTTTLKTLEKAHVTFDLGIATFKLLSQTPSYRELVVSIPRIWFDIQLRHIVQLLTSCFPPFFTLEDLYIYEGPNVHSYEPSVPDWRPDWHYDIEDTPWLDLFHPFIAVKNLYLSEEFAPVIAHVLQGIVGGRTTEVLPTLHNIFIEGCLPSGPIQEGIVQFIAARQVTNHPIAVSRWDRDLEQERAQPNQWLRNGSHLISN